jgi:hypothetical protein
MLNTASGVFGAVADYVQRGIDAGVFRQVDPRDVAFLLIEIIRGSAFAMIHSPADLRPSGKAENIISILLDGIRKRNQM